MKFSDLPIPFTRSIPEFTPRKVLGGRNPAFTEAQNEVLDAIEVLEQKSNWGCNAAASAWNFCLILAIMFLGVDGVRIVRWAQSVIGAPQAMSQPYEHRHEETRPLSEPMSSQNPSPKP